MATAIVNWQLDLAVEARRCPLRSRAGEEEKEEEEGEGEEKEKKEEKQILIKSKNPRLAGGKQG